MKPGDSSKHLQGITDLTLVAPISRDLISALDTRTRETRLRMLMRTLNSLRAASREHSAVRPFTDTVERIQMIQSFRLAILEPEKKLLLAVTFDGPWEAYIREIWGPLGTLLDVIFCNCAGYKNAFDSTFDEYVRWIREHQVDAGFFYNHSALTVSDFGYLRQAEEHQRTQRDPHAFDRAAATFVFERPEKTAEKARADLGATKRLGLTALGALYRLTPLYPGDDLNGEGGYLLRAAHELLKEFDTPTLFPASSIERKLFSAQLEWFEKPRQPRRSQLPERLTYRAQDVQGGILASYEKITHGCLVLISAQDGASGRAFLQWLEPLITTGDAKPAGPYRNVALTLDGLRRLGVPEQDLEKFPKEFREGMEARAGLLGDFRGNHPRNWKLPLRNWPLSAGGPADRVELSSVDIVVQLRIEAPGDTAIDFDAKHPLYGEVAALAARPGIRVLSVQPMRRYLDPKIGYPRDHFGFVDGFSQPIVDNPPPGTNWSDEVPRGEIFCGYNNHRSDSPAANDYLDNSTFLVVRKLRQDVKALNDALDAAGKAAPLSLTRDELKAKMVGRTLDGVPLVPGSTTAENNDFNYVSDRLGACPHAAHIRRANPRARKTGSPDPRIMRRGMSYGARYDPSETTEVDRGIVFMAYNASIAEQFEVIQRWISGGNSTEIFSGQGDPLLGVPQQGSKRTFRFLHNNEVVRADLDDPSAPRPFVELQWGAYLYVPSMAALAKLGALQPAPPAQDPADAGKAFIEKLLALEAGGAPAEKVIAAWKMHLEDLAAIDSGVATAIWAAVRKHHGGVLRTAYGVLVGTKQLAMEVFLNADARYSVRGYMQRMQKTIGEIYLGLDEGQRYQDESTEVNKAMMAITSEQAFASAHRHASALLHILVTTADPREGVLLDTSLLSDVALGLLAQEWFGIPDDQHVHRGGWDWDASRPRCPGHFTSPSRYIFSPRPFPAVERYARDHSAALGAAVAAFVRDCRADGSKASGHRLLEAILKAVPASEDARAVRTLIGGMMGFLPTVDGSFRSILYEWVSDKSLWRLQQALLAKGAPIDHASASAALLGPLMRTMQRRPVPDMVWRRVVKPHALGSVSLVNDDHVVIGIVSATHEDLAGGRTDVAPIFGGRRDQSPAPTHACPAYFAALGTLLGMIAALFEAATIRPSPSPSVLTLFPRPGGSAPAPAAVTQVKTFLRI